MNEKPLIDSNNEKVLSLAAETQCRRICLTR
jgi:hypothetical protein